LATFACRLETNIRIFVRGLPISYDFVLDDIVYPVEQQPKASNSL
jgi:hypothetical protein